MEISSYLRNSPEPVSTSQSQSISPSPATTTQYGASNSVGDHGSTAQAGSGPTDGGRETTTGTKTPGYAESEQMVSERLANDPEYQELSAKLEKWKNIENDFALVDANTGLFPDGTVTLDNLRALAGDPLARADARAAANRLLSDMSVWNEISKGDNIAGTQDVMAFVAGMKAGLKTMKEAVRAEIKGEVAAASNTAGSTNAASTGSNTAVSAPQLFKPPTLSTKPGMEGAVENIKNTLTSIGDEMSQITSKLSDPNLSPADRNKLQASYNELQQLQAMLMAMYKQLQEAIANMIKMYSDVAQNSIRNMR